MSFSIQRETSDGTLSTLDLTIEYIDRTDVRAYVDDIEIDLTGGSTPYTWEWITPSQIKITPDVPNGLVAMIKRSTPMDAMYHIFDAGAVFKDETVDENFQQVLFLSQEAKEGSGVSDIYSNVNMHGYVIGNHGAAVLDGDLVTFGQYRNDALGAGFNRMAAEAARDVAVAAKNTAVASTVAAALSETNAAASELAAANSATSANDDRILAENAAMAAAGSLEQFTDQYLGPKPADPTLDNDGDVLLDGALYFNTSANEMRVYDGSTWIVAYNTGGVTTFNSRTGTVLPQAGDYTKGDVGLGNVDNTSDANKPISTATQTALNTKLTNPITAQGDLITSGTGPTFTPTRIALGVVGDVLTAGASGPEWAQPAVFMVEYLLVAGGGSGGTHVNNNYASAGGGGAGGVKTGFSFATRGFNYPVVVGAGGIAPSVLSVGADGGSSSFQAESVLGGGGGGVYVNPGRSGGSGGGGGGATAAGGAGTAGQGFAGGNATTNSAGGGGGGASQVGSNGSAAGGGKGGDGVSSSITGVAITYAGGGGGGANATAAGAGGSGGGGTGGANSGGIGANGTNGLGGGGGGQGSGPNAGGKGGNGGSGVVIIRYLGLPRATGGTITQVGGYTIHTFTTSGTLAAL